MKHLPALAIALALMLSAALALNSAAQTPEPTPAATQSIGARLCVFGPPLSGPTYAGGESIVAAGGVSVRPPGGGTFTLPIQPPDGPANFTICYIEGDANITIARDCCPTRIDR